MKILNLLNEGVIKVPEKSFKALMNVVCTDVFSRVETILNFKHIEDDYPELENIWRKVMGKYEKLYGEFPIYNGYTADLETAGTITINLAEVDKRYLSRSGKRTAIYTIKVRVKSSNINSSTEGGYGEKRKGKPSNIMVGIPNMKHLELVVKSPELFEAMMDRIEGVAEHELMHAIQNMAFGLKVSGVDYYDKNKEIIDDKYYTHDIEYSPQMVTASKNFIAYIKELRALGLPVDADKVKTLFTFFAKPGKTPAGIQPHASNFLWTLYKTDQDKWKKAVKIIYGLIQGKV